MNNKRTSKVWKLEESLFIDLIKNSTRMKDVLSYFSLQNKGNNFKTVKSRINELQLDISHFLSKSESSRFSRKMTLDKFKENCLCEHATMNRGHVKEYILKFGLMEYKCNMCGNTGTWLNQKLSLHLEHINGISDDNRITNLCFLCPNCHSQTDTYAGKKRTKSNIGEKSARKTKIVWPPLQEMEKLIWSMPSSALALKLGVSDVAIGKHCKKYNISKPSRGFWSGRDIET